MTDYVTCSCCGTRIEDTPEANVDHDARCHDAGFGVCAPCAEWQFKKFFAPIFAKVRSSLNEENQAKWDSYTDGTRAEIVAQMVDEGVLSWGVR